MVARVPVDIPMLATALAEALPALMGSLGAIEAEPTCFVCALTTAINTGTVRPP